MLEVRNITYLWPSGPRKGGIRDVSFTLNPNQILGVIGKSGSGKSTLALCLSGLLDLQNGEIIFNGEKLLGPSEQLIPGHKDIALLRQDVQILENHTVLENLRDVLVGFDEEFKRKQINRILRITGLLSFENQKAKLLSMGQKQRLSLARTMIHVPKVLILDEPFNHLDFEWKFKLTEWILEEQSKQGFSILWITHDSSEILRYCHRTVCLHGGKKICEGAPMKIYANPKSKAVAALFGPYMQLGKGKKKIFLRPGDVIFDTKKNSGMEKGILLRQYFNGICHENILLSEKGTIYVGYDNRCWKENTKGYLRIQKRY
ncbi:MAG: ABC transporter ATP-binding protein [Bacteroidia bacterium]|nr:ABC transporter ATP-binding protein [Bacteroidia bacterium]